MKKQHYLQLLINTFKSWRENNVSRLAAALSYFTVFSLAPFLVICIALASMYLGRESAQSQVLQEVSNIVGTQSADQIHLMINSASMATKNVVATIIGFILLLFGATGLFGQLQAGLNTIWGVKPKAHRAYLHILKNRFLAVTMTIGIAFLFLFSLVISTATTAWANYINGILPSLKILWLGSDFLLSFAITSILFAMIFQSLPGVLIEWSNVWIGALVTAFLFTIGKFFLAIFLSKINVNTVYGTAGSLIVILIWIYYSAQILFLGAIFTKLYAQARGYKIIPNNQYTRV